jgi:hypothetical protein
MWRKTFGSLMFLGAVASPAWAQEAAKPEQAGNLQTWPLILAVGGVIYIVLLMIYVLRRQKLQKRIVDRSLRLSEERNELARQQLALQAETNRLLERLIAERGQG